MHTDDNMLLEFSAGRRVFAPTDTTHLSNFSRSMEMPPLALMDRALAERVALQMHARRDVMTGTLEFFKGHMSDGIALYESAYALTPSDPYVLWAYVEGHTKLAYSLAARRDYAGALKAYLEAAVEPAYQHTWIAYDGVAFCASKLGEYGEARHYYELSLAANPFNHASSHNLATLYMREQNPAGAERVFEGMLAISPDDPEAAGGLARIYASRGESPDTALRLAKMAAASERDATNYITLGWLYYSRGQLDEARKVLKKALKMVPDDSETLYRLGLVEVASVNRARATNPTLKR
jgi:tetratricopeptide (TPR) repeat protein